MAKPTQIKGKQELKTPANEKRELAPARASSGSLQRVTTPSEAATPHSPAMGGASRSHEKIRVRAYQLWEAQGKPVATDSEHWFEAERLLLQSPGSPVRP